MKITTMLVFAVIVGFASSQLHASQAPPAAQRAPSQVMQATVNVPVVVKSPKLYYVAKDMQVYCTKGFTGQILCLTDYNNFPKCNNNVDRPVAFSRYTDQEMENRALDNNLFTEEFVDVIGYDMSLQYSSEPVPVMFALSPTEKAKWQSFMNTTANYELRAVRAIRACMNFSDFLTD